MRDYQPKKDDGYKLDKVVFKRMTLLVKDYARMKLIINDIETALPIPETPRPEGRYADPTAHKAVKTERLREECSAVEWALAQIPKEYQKIIFSKVCCDAAYPLCADASTFSRWKYRFLYYIAEKLSYI